MALDHVVEHDQELSETGGQRHILRLPRGKGPYAVAHTVRWPRRLPLSRLKAATPSRAATSPQFKVPNSGSRAIRVAVTMGPTPGTLWGSCHKGPERKKSA